jgi:hypothetical protein
MASNPWSQDRGQGQISLTVSDGTHMDDTLILGFWPPALQHNKFQWFKPLCLWHFNGTTRKPPKLPRVIITPFSRWRNQSSGRLWTWPKVTQLKKQQSWNYTWSSVAQKQCLFCSLGHLLVLSQWASGDLLGHNSEVSNQLS